MYSLEEIKEIMQKNNCADLEMVTLENYGRGLHTDNIKMNVDILGDRKIVDYYIMNEKEYNNTMCANSSITANFEDWYGNKEAKVIVVIVGEVE